MKKPPAQSHSRQPSVTTHVTMNSIRNLLLTSRAVLALALTLSLSAPARAADNKPPEKMTYQGYLVDGNGQPLGNTDTGPKNYDAIFRIYDDQVASAPANRLWAEGQTVTVDKGYFSVLLGEGNQYGSEPHGPLSSLFAAANASNRYLEITVKGVGAGSPPADVTIMPRLHLLTSPYAFLAKTAVNANNLVNSASAQVVNITSTNVGINKASPATALDVNGTVTASGLKVNGTAQVTSTLTVNTVVATNTITAKEFAGHGVIPVGGIIMWSGSTAPTGWALCDGSTVNGRKTPDLRGRFVLSSGSASGLTARTINQTGGEEQHTLTVSEMPAHTHTATGTSGSAGGHTHGYYSGHGSTAGIRGGDFNSGEIGYRSHYNTTSSDGAHTHPITVTVSNSGGGAAHNNMPPYYVLAFIMRVY
jgi:microcystin-dependent protein